MLDPFAPPPGDGEQPPIATGICKLAKVPGGCHESKSFVGEHFSKTRRGRQSLDLLAQDSMQIMLQGGEGAGQVRQPNKGQRTYFAVFQRPSAASVPFTADGIQAQDFARQFKPDNLLTAIQGRHGGFERADPDGKEEVQWVANQEQRATPPDFNALGNQGIQPLDFRQTVDRSAPLVPAPIARDQRQV